MFGVAHLTFEDRVYEFACDATYGSGRINSLMKKYNLDFRKGKTLEDILKARQLAYKECNRKSDMYYEDIFANKLEKIVKSI